MSSVLYACLAGGIAFLVYLVITTLAFQFMKLKYRFPFLHGLNLTILILIFSGIFNKASTLVPNGNFDRFILIFIFLIAAYFFAMIFYAALDHAVRLRLLVEMYISKESSLSLEEILRLYSPNEAARARLEQLTGGGYLIKNGNHYTLSSKGKMIALVTKIGCGIFKIK